MNHRSTTNKEQFEELRNVENQYQAENNHMWQEEQTFEKISENEKEAVGKLRALLEQQTVITEILQQLQTTDNLHETINRVISHLGEYFQASSVTIFENSPDGNSISNSFEWCNDGVIHINDKFQNVS